MNLNEFFNKLAADNSRNFKLDTLKANVNDVVLRQVISLALDPFTNFYQRKIPTYKPNTTSVNLNLTDGFPYLYQLCNRLVTGNAAIDKLTELLEKVSVDDAKVIERIIKKDLMCGVSISTANSVWPGLIKEYPVMLCSGYEQKLVDKIKFPAYAQLKMDGMRFNAIVKNETCEFRSRNGKEILLDTDLKDQFIAIAAGSEMVFDGELMVMDPDGCQFMDRQTGNGILKKAIKGTISDTEAALVRAIVWDVIPYMYFIDGYCPTSYKDRFARFKWGIDFPEKIQLVQSTIAENIEEARIKFEEYYNAGQEGIILKDMNSPWEDKRAKHQIKFKGELECDLKVVGYEEGTGKYVGKLGALVCESDDGIIKVKVGSGFNDENRESIKKQDVIGKVVAVKYNARIRSKSEDESLFLPIFLEIREDKTQADSSGSIK
jgi:hypothetical protein